MELPQLILYAEIVFAVAALGIIGAKSLGPKGVKGTLSKVSHRLHLHS